MVKGMVRPEDRFAYYDKLAGRWRHFMPKVYESIVTLREQATEAELREAVRDDLGFGPFVDLDRRVARLYSVGSPLERVNSLPGILNAIPVVLDHEGYDRYFIPDEILVLARQSVSISVMENFLQSSLLAGSRVLDYNPAFAENIPSVFVVSVPEGMGLFEAIEVLVKWEEVIFVGPSEVAFDPLPEVVTTDIEEVEGEEDFWSLGRIDLVRAWTFTEGDPSVVIAVVDSGADLSHVDLASNILPRNGADWDFLDPDDLSPDDVMGHGTHVCGTAAAVRNGVGVVGVAPGCRLMPLRVDRSLDFNVDRINAINYVAGRASQEPDLRFVVNCSWFIKGDDPGVHLAIKNAVQANTLVVVSAGNNGAEPPVYPAIYPEAIAVAATMPDDRKWDNSNYGVQVDVSAPGFEIASTWLGGKYAKMSGTSSAAPHVSGLAALIWSRNLGLSNSQVRSILEDSCDPIDNLNKPKFRGKLGRGRINAFRALSRTPAP